MKCMSGDEIVTGALKDAKLVILLKARGSGDKLKFHQYSLALAGNISKLLNKTESDKTLT